MLTQSGKDSSFSVAFDNMADSFLVDNPSQKKRAEESLAVSTLHNHYYKPHDPRQEFVVDTFAHYYVGIGGLVDAHLFTDLASHQVSPVFTKTKLVLEFTQNMSVLFFAHTEWKPNVTAVDRKIKVAMETEYQSSEFSKFCHTELRLCLHEISTHTA